MAEKGQSRAARAGVLIGEQAEQQPGVRHRRLQRRRFGAPLEKQAAGFFAQSCISRLSEGWRKPRYVVAHLNTGTNWPKRA